MASQGVHDRVKRAEHRAALVVEPELTPVERGKRLEELADKWRAGLSPSERAKFAEDVAAARKAFSVGDWRTFHAPEDFRREAEAKYGPSEGWPDAIRKEAIRLHMVERDAWSASKEFRV